MRLPSEKQLQRMTFKRYLLYTRQNREVNCFSNKFVTNRQQRGLRSCLKRQPRKQRRIQYLRLSKEFVHAERSLTVRIEKLNTTPKACAITATMSTAAKILQPSAFTKILSLMLDRSVKNATTPCSIRFENMWCLKCKVK